MVLVGLARNYSQRIVLYSVLSDSGSAISTVPSRAVAPMFSWKLSGNVLYSEFINSSTCLSSACCPSLLESNPIYFYYNTFLLILIDGHERTRAKYAGWYLNLMKLGCDDAPSTFTTTSGGVGRGIDWVASPKDGDGRGCSSSPWITPRHRRHTGLGGVKACTLVDATGFEPDTS